MRRAILPAQKIRVQKGQPHGVVRSARRYRRRRLPFCNRRNVRGAPALGAAAAGAATAGAAAGCAYAGCARGRSHQGRVRSAARSIPEPGASTGSTSRSSSIATKPAPVMVFQDGIQYNAPVVFDNLIHAKAIPPMVGVFVMHGRVRAPNADALDRMNRSYEYDSVSGRLRAVPARRAAAARRKDPRPESVERPERSRHRRQQQRRDCGVRRGVAASGRLPPRLQRHRHLRRTARRQRVPRADPQDRAEADSHLPPGRPQRSEQLHRQLVRRQPGHAVGAGIRRLRREVRMGRRRAQLAARHPDLSPGHDLVVARLAGAAQGKSGRQVEAGRLSSARRWRGMGDGRRRLPRHRRPRGQRQGRDVLHRSAEQSHPQGRPRRHA